MNKKISDQQLLASLQRLERLADLTDSRFRIPFTNVRFGLDSLIGLIPVVGDGISLIMSFYLLIEASKLGTPFSLKTKMLGNIVLDLLIGLIPLVGDAADVVFKANNKNMKLLLTHINQDFQNRSVMSEPEKGSYIPKLLVLLVLALIVSLGIYYGLLSA